MKIKISQAKLMQIIREEVQDLSEPGTFRDNWNPDAPSKGIHDGQPTMAASPSANALRRAIAEFVVDNPQLGNPRKTVIQIAKEVVNDAQINEDWDWAYAPDSPSDSDADDYEYGGNIYDDVAATEAAQENQPVLRGVIDDILKRHLGKAYTGDVGGVQLLNDIMDAIE